MDLKIVNLLVLLLCSFQSVFSEENSLVVTTDSGKIKGFNRYSLNNRSYRVFKDIPYAKPPVGDLRFKNPVPVEAWSDELDGTNTTPKICAQLDMLNNQVKGEEDCLYLNVYTPHSGEGPLFPVIFWIHGGAFQYGSSSEDQPKYFMDKDVVFVNINYRLGPFGFLSTGDESLPGNYGLKDQNVALQWVVKNIKYFGGDPERITLQGCSAGGASVHYHYLSPLSKGLFQNGISMSGNALMAWAFAKNPMEDTKKVADFVNCPTTDSKVLVDCLRGLSAAQIGEAASKLLLSEHLAYDIDRPPFRPVVENSNDGAFISRSPIEIIKSGEVNDVPWIAGVDTEEGIMLTRGMLLNQTRLSYADENWDQVGAYMMFVQDDVPKERHAEVARAARKHYLGDKPLKIEDLYALKQLIQLIGDKGFSYDAQRAAVLQASVTKSPVRLYHYGYRANHSLGDDLIRNDKVNFGVCHCDDEVLIVEDRDGKITTHPKDMKMQVRMINMIYSYVKNGKPSFGMDWPKINPFGKKISYMHIGGPNNVEVRTTDDFAHKTFWNSIGM